MTTLGMPAALPAIHDVDAAAEPRMVVLGVDTHKDVHVAAVLDHLGRLLSSGEFPATAAGYRHLLDWARKCGTVLRAGVECTGSYGAGLARYLATQQVSVVGTIAIAQTLVILTAGIDLSVGAGMILASMVMAQTAVNQGIPALLALLIGLLAGLATGAINGFLVTRFKLPPFIVTLGTLNVYLALTLLYSHGATVRGSDMPGLLTWRDGLPDAITSFHIVDGRIAAIYVVRNPDKLGGVATMRASNVS